MQATVTMIIQYKLRKLLLCDVEDNTQLIPPAPKANYTLLFCIELCLVEKHG